MTRAQIIRQIELAVLALTRIPPSIVQALSYLLAGAGAYESIAWLNSMLTCIALLAVGNEGEAALCFSKLYVEASLEAPTRALVSAVINEIENFLGGKKPMAGFPTITTPPACTTPKARHKGICCTALTQLGAAQAAIGFTYTSCTGRTICLKCGIGTSTSTNPRKTGLPIFIPRRVQCGPSGCPALLTQ